LRKGGDSSAAAAAGGWPPFDGKERTILKIQRGILKRSFGDSRTKKERMKP
jgi:hypothetical protein